MRTALASLFFVVGCSPPAPEPPVDVLDALARPVFEDRVATRIAELEVSGRPAQDSERRAPEEGEVSALVDLFVSGKGRMRDVPLDEMKALSAAAHEELMAIARDESLGADVRNAALHLVFASDLPAGLERVVEVLESAAEPWRRRYAAWLLGQSDDDRFLLRMLLPLRYEKDGETVVWLAEALANHGNYAGLEGLRLVVAGGGSTASLAQSKRDEIVAAASIEGVDAAGLEELWCSPGFPPELEHVPSDALRLAAWREVSELSSERFQLRGVDDARFVLSRTGPWGARLVADALADRDGFVRLHAAQVLERMGARARPVASALHPLLRDPRTAHAAAEALGALGAPQSLPLLRAGLAPHHAHELRVAASHGLRRFGSGAAAPDLRRVLSNDTTPDDLRLAAAAALVSCAEDPLAIRVLVDGMSTDSDDPQGCELGVQGWIESNARSGSKAFETLLENWRDLQGPPALLRTSDDTRARLARRAALVRKFIEPNS